VIRKKVSHAIISPESTLLCDLGGEIDDETDLLATIPPHDSISSIELLYAYTPETEAPHQGSQVHISIDRQGAGWADVTCRFQTLAFDGEPETKTLAALAGKIFPRSAYDGDVHPLSHEEKETPLFFFGLTRLEVHGSTPEKQDKPLAYAASLYTLFQQLANRAFYCQRRIDPDLADMISTRAYQQSFTLSLNQEAPTRAALLEAFA
jgi:hypothetical protein